MPKLIGMSPQETHQTVHKYSFTGQALDKLGASKYTLVTLVIDASPSITDYVPDMEKMIKEVVKACKRDPNSEELMFRVVTFNTDLTQIHGFVELREVDVDGYDGVIKVAGSTALYEATLESIEATKAYGSQLVQMDYTCNGVTFILTDGWNNQFRIATPDLIKETLQKLKKDEGASTAESMNVILIAASDDTDVVDALKDFHRDAALTQLVEMGECTEDNLAKLGGFIHSSISSSSQALGSGGPSQPCTF